MEIKYWDFELASAYEFAQLAKLSYLRFEDGDAHKVLLQGELKKLGYDLVDVFHSKDTDTQAFLARKSSFAVISFRGTEHNLRDILTDLDASLHEFYGGHVGFFGGFEGIRLEVEKALDELGDLPLVATGHSLGGALAKAAIIMQPKRNYIACYTYGSPPVCTREVCETVRVPVFLMVNRGDIVPCVMIVGGPVAKAALWAMRQVSRFLASRGQDNKEIERIFDQVERLRKGLGDYAHFPNVQSISDNGELKPLKDGTASTEIFIRILLQDYRKVFEHHGMDRYVEGLEKLVKG